MNDQSLMAERTDPVIVHKGGFKVAGLRYEGQNEHGEIPAMWDIFIPRIHELIPDTSVGIKCYGIAREMPGVPPEQGFEYLAGVEVESLDHLPAGMVGWEIPALTYAVFPAHDVPGIAPVLDYFYKQWLPHSPHFSAGDSLSIELYPPSFSEDHIIQLYLPVRPR